LVKLKSLQFNLLERDLPDAGRILKAEMSVYIVKFPCVLQICGIENTF